MAINLTFMATEAPAVLYLPDGSSKQFPAQEEENFQLPSGSFCTISSTAGTSSGSEEDYEHMSPEDKAIAFAEKMLAFWASFIDTIRLKAQQPTATPM